MPPPTGAGRTGRSIQARELSQPREVGRRGGSSSVPAAQHAAETNAGVKGHAGDAVLAASAATLVCNAGQRHGHGPPVEVTLQRIEVGCSRGIEMREQEK